MRFFYIVCFSLLLIIAVSPVLAQGSIDFYIYPEDLMHGRVDSQTGLTYAPPSDPSYEKVKYLKAEPPGSLQEQINRLIHGIKVDMPPEYDQYGYEMRRYMAHAGNPEIYQEQTRVKDELNNVLTAKIIFSYWVADLDKQMKEIEAGIEKENASGNARSSYNYNRGVVDAFKIECQSWLDNNESILRFLSENPDIYMYEDSYLKFRDPDAYEAFAAMFEARQKSRETINKYPPFSMMVY